MPAFEEGVAMHTSVSFSTADGLTDCQLIHDIIRHITCYMDGTPHPLENKVRRIIRALRWQAAEAVILGCTELPLLLFAERADADIIDSTRLLAEEAVLYALEPRHSDQWTRA